MLDWVREHPYLAGSLGVGVVLLIVLMRRGGSSSGGTVVTTTGPSESLQAMQVQAGAALENSRITANNQIAGYNAQVNITELLAANDLEKTRLAAVVRLNEIFATVDVTKYTTDAQLKLGLAQVGQGANPSVVPPSSGGSEVPLVYGAGNSPVYAGSGAAVVSPAYSSAVPKPKSGESWSDFLGDAFSGQPINNPNDPNDRAGAIVRNGVWAGALMAFETDPSSIHNLPVGDWRDATGQLQSCGSMPNDPRCR